MMQALANSAAFWVLLILALCAVYLLPTIIGVVHRVDRLALVFLVNLIGGTTGVGWFAALVLAFGLRRLPPVPPSASWRPPGRAPVPWPPSRLRLIAARLLTHYSTRLRDRPLAEMRTRVVRSSPARSWARDTDDYSLGYVAVLGEWRRGRDRAIKASCERIHKTADMEPAVVRDRRGGPAETSSFPGSRSQRRLPACVA
jgi:hypothetical protein